MSLGSSDEAYPSFVKRAVEAAKKVNGAVFPLSLTHAGTFRSDEDHFFGWFGCNDIDASLFDLRMALYEQLRLGGVRSVDSSSFSPHVTLVRDAARPLPERAFAPISCLVDSVVLARTIVEPTLGHDDLEVFPPLH